MDGHGKIGMILAVLGLLTVALTMSSCDSRDERVVEMARESSQRQAEQNQQMARLSEQVAETSKRLVEEDAKARTEMVGVHRELQKERSEVGFQRDSLEADRRQLADARQREPIVAAAITTTGLLLACLAPLVIAWLCLRQAGKSNADADVAEMLTLDLTADEPLLTAASAPRPLLEHQPGNRDAGAG